MAGMFDDLVPQTAAAPAGGGMFDDLVPKAAQPSKGVAANGMLPGFQGNMDAAKAGNNWSTFEVSQNGIPAHMVLPTQPGDKPPSGDGISMGDAVDRYLKSGQSYGGFDTDELGAKYMQGATPQEQPDFWHNFRVGTQAVGEGLANWAGTPVDLANTVLQPVERAIGMTPASAPIGGSQWIKNDATAAANAVGYPVYDRNTLPESQKLAYDIDNFGAQGLGMGGLASLFTRAPAAVAAAPKLANALVAPYETAPVHAAVTDTITGAGAGAGHNASNGNPWADLAMTMLGGSGANVAQRMAEGGAGKVANFATAMQADKNIPGQSLPNWVTRGAAQKVAGAAVDPLRAADTIDIEAARFNANDLPHPTTGVMSQDLGSISAERSARTKDPVPFVQADSRLRSAASDKVNSLMDPEADQGAVAAAAQSARTARMQPAEVAQGNASQAVDRLLQQRVAEGAPLADVKGADTRAAASKQVDESLMTDIVKPARTAKNQAFDQAKAQAGDSQVSALPVVDAVAKVRQNLTPFLSEGAQLPNGISREFIAQLDNLMEPAAAPKEAAGFMPSQAEAPAAPTGNVKAADLAGVRPYLATAEQGARQSGNYQLADSIRAMRNSVNTAIEAAPQYADANKVYKEQFAPVARGGGEVEQFVRKVERDPNRVQTAPSDTADRFLSGPEKLADLRKVLKSNPAGKQGIAAAQTYLRSSFARSALNDDGTINGMRASRWASNNADLLKEFPEAASEVQGYVKTAQRGETMSAQAKDALKKANGDVETARNEIDQSAIGTLLNKDPRQVAASALSDKYGGADKLAEVNKIIGADKQAQRGWKAAVAEVVRDRVTDATKVGTESGEAYKANLNALNKTFKNNEDALATVFSPEEMNTLRRAHSVLEPLARLGDVQATPGPNTADKLSGLATWEKAIRLKFGALQGSAIARKVHILMSAFPEAEHAIPKLVERSWFDPEIASYLLRKGAEKGAEKPPKSVINRLLAGMQTAKDLSEVQNPQDDQAGNKN